jgi:hypothetical protein
MVHPGKKKCFNMLRSQKAQEVMMRDEAGLQRERINNENI